jgi:hypothetical protein
MKTAVTMAVLCMLLVGCGRSDARIQKDIVGNWMGDSNFDMTLSPDGSLVWHWAEPNKSLTYRGIWKIQDGAIVIKLTNYIVQGYSNLLLLPVGTVQSYAVIRADENDLVYSNGNEILSFRRK